jgi:hypothetical protein
MYDLSFLCSHLKNIFHEAMYVVGHRKVCAIESAVN